MKPSLNKYRADELLVIQGLTTSRSLAKALILEGKVFIDNTPILKPSKMFMEGTPLRVSEPPRYVSRAGEKLEKFITHYEIDTYEKKCLDIGASTGGFTDFLLQNRASHVTCLDVGHSQLHSKVLENSKTRNLEKTNARTVSSKELPYPLYDLIVIDVSFISLKKVLPNVWNFLNPNGILVALIKPQFEATQAEISQGKGIIRYSEIHERIKKDIEGFAVESLQNSQHIGTLESPIKGTDGNIEFISGFKNEITPSI